MVGSVAAAAARPLLQQGLAQRGSPCHTRAFDCRPAPCAAYESYRHGLSFGELPACASGVFMWWFWTVLHAMVRMCSQIESRAVAGQCTVRWLLLTFSADI